jgi:hypothetical protein
MFPIAIFSAEDRKGPVSAETTVERQIDPQHCVSFKEAGSYAHARRTNGTRRSRSMTPMAQPIRTTSTSSRKR